MSEVFSHSISPGFFKLDGTFYYFFQAEHETWMKLVGWQAYIKAGNEEKCLLDIIP